MIRCGHNPEVKSGLMTKSLQALALYLEVDQPITMDMDGGDVTHGTHAATPIDVHATVEEVGVHHDITPVVVALTV